MRQHITVAETSSLPAAASVGFHYDECWALWNQVKSQIPFWSGEFFTDPFGALNLMILPPDADDDIGPMLIIYKQHGFYLLDTFRWDEYDNNGSYLTLADTLTAIVSILAKSAHRRPPSFH